MIAILALFNDFFAYGDSSFDHVVNKEFFLLLTEVTEEEGVHEEEEDFHLGSLVFGDRALS